MRLSKHLHGHSEIRGFNVMPTAFFWLRKSRDMGSSEEICSRGGKFTDKVIVLTAWRKCRLARNSSNVVPIVISSGIAAKSASSGHGGQGTRTTANAPEYWSSRSIWMQSEKKTVGSTWINKHHNFSTFAFWWAFCIYLEWVQEYASTCDPTTS